ncbi:MAG: transcription termination/antitermination protein NusG [Candidatus Binatia bacterium]|nr:transcription termination/antitermination protein NusG [Candidatus Binatia bacterium]
MQKQWYAIRTYIGCEQRVQVALQQKIRECGQQDAFGAIVIPTEKVIEFVRGKKHIVERRLFPGYLLVEMVFNDDTWHLVHSVPKVIGFVGESGTAPTPIPAEKVAEILEQVEKGMAVPRPRRLFTVGEKVKIVAGPLRDFTGTVEAIRPERARVRVAVSVFGRPTPVELDFAQVEAA